MAPPAIDYTSRDFDAIKLALRTHLQNKFPTTWRSFYEADLGMAYLELVAYVFDILSFYLDYQANETFLNSARDRVNVINICKLIGYKLRPPTSAAVTVTATLPAIYPMDVIVPAGETITTAQGVTFRTLTEQRVAAGSLTSELVFAEGELQSETFASSGAAWQKIRLTHTAAIDGSIVVTVSGDVWTEVDSLVLASTSSQAYSVEYDENDYAYIQFGDSTNGQAPPAGASIVVAYRIGGGLRGNIDLEELVGDVQGYQDGTTPPVYVTVSVLNDTYRGSGGEDRETIGHAKLWAPRWVTTNGRAVTEQDFDTLANTFSDPTYGTFAFAKAKLKQNIPELNTVEIYTWARDSGGDIVAPSQGLKDALYDYFMNNGAGAVRVICTDVEVLDGYIVYIDISVEVTIDSQYAASQVSTVVRANLSELFSSSENVPGTYVRISRLYDAIQDSLGVSHAVIGQITASYRSTETIGTGDGIVTNFVTTLDLDPNLPVVPGTVLITAGAQSITDDGNGHLAGDVDPTGTNTVDYDTGDVDVTFANPPASGTIVYCRYRHVLDYSRNEQLEVYDGDALIEGAVAFPPIVPYDPITGQKGIAFTDGIQTVRDWAGDGKLYDAVGGTQVGTVDYDTGSFSFQFPAVPGVGAAIWASYDQMLRTPSEDIPINKLQLAVEGNIVITTS